MLHDLHGRKRTQKMRTSCAHKHSTLVGSQGKACIRDAWKVPAPAVLASAYASQVASSAPVATLTILDYHVST